MSTVQGPRIRRCSWFVPVLAPAMLAAATQTASAQPLALSYNFNGLVHGAAEQGQPDSLTGFRSISDRSLLIDGAAGSLGTNPITGANGISYSIVQTAGLLDIVHLGNRTINFAYEAAAPGVNPNIGIQPTWDSTPNHTTPQLSDVSAQGITLFANSEIGVLYMISNGGGQFDVTLTFTDASSVTCRLAGPDWFGVPAVPARLNGVSIQSRLGGTSQRWASTENTDSGTTAPITPTDRRLSVIEGVISVAEMIADGLGNHAGKTLQSISFGNATYSTATPGTGRGYAILAASHRGAAIFPPTAIASATPSTVGLGNTTRIAVTVTPGSAPNSIVSGSVDLSSIGGTPIALNDSGLNGDVTAGDNIWSVDAVIPGSAIGGPATLPFTITDVQSRTATGNVGLTIVAPPASTDLGTLTSGTSATTDALNPGEIRWYRFTLAAPIAAANLEILDIDTEGSTLTGGQFADDTYIALYDANGVRIALDDDDGTGFRSQLTFGAATPARPAPGDGLAYNGRDGATLPAGTYFLGITAFNASAGTANWALTTSHTHTGTISLNIRLGQIPGPGGPPAAFTDLGSLTSSASSTQPIAVAGGVTWFRFDLPVAIAAANPTRTFLDIDTETSAITDTIIALFRADGTLVGTDNNDGSGTYSQLTFGRGTRAAVGDGLAYSGRDGATLIAGTYYLAVGESNLVFATGFIAAFGSGPSTGNVTVSLRTGVQSPIIAGPINNPANGHDYYLLESGFTWTDAEAFAVTLGGHLASINDADENEFVRASVLRFDGTDRRGWIGYTDQVIEGTFEWSDGSTTTYTNWGPGEPNNGGPSLNEDHVEMLGNGVWNDLSNAGAATGDFAIVEVVPPPSCPADFDGSGSLSVQDIFEFLNAWFASLPSADFDGMNGTDVQDIFSFLNAWFAGC